MKVVLSHIIILFVGWSTLSSIQAQDMLAMVETTTISSEETEKENVTELPRRLIRKFKRDAARLALRMEAEQDDLRYGNIFIPSENVESIYEVLSLIYLNDETAQAIARCNVHTFPNPSIDHFKIIFDRNIDWATPLQDGITETNSQEINDLLDEYDLIIENHERWTDTEDIMVIRSKSPLNMAALSNEFYNIEGIVEIDLGIPEVGGNDILIERRSNGWEVSYVLKFGGTYIKGQGKQHTWSYLVSDSGTVTFKEEAGDPIPTYMKCSPTKKLATNE